LGFGVLAQTPNPQSPIPNPQSPMKNISSNIIFKNYLIKVYTEIFLNIIIINEK